MAKLVVVDNIKISTAYSHVNFYESLKGLEHEHGQSCIFLVKHNKKESIMYEITVKRTVMKTMPAGKDYNNTHKKDENGEDIWGYVPKPAYETEVEEIVFTQKVETIDLTKVIMAINAVDIKS